MSDIVKHIEESRERMWSSFATLFEHFDAPPNDRYAGEFGPTGSGTPTLSQIFKYGDLELRDDLAEALSTVAAKFNDIKIIREDSKRDGERWPHQLEITARHGDVYGKMVEFLAAAARQYPVADKGMEWEEYLSSYDISDRMRYKAAALRQIEMFGMLPKLSSDIVMRVVGTHTSKSIELPVVQLELKNNRTQITIRNNFHDICVSVKSRFPVSDKRDYKTLFNTAAVDGFFEGFPTAAKFGTYDKNKQEFSCTVRGYPELFMLVSDILRQDEATPFKRIPRKPAVQPV